MVLNGENRVQQLEIKKCGVMTSFKTANFLQYISKLLVLYIRQVLIN
jgi:hypothetical protein